MPNLPELKENLKGYEAEQKLRNAVCAACYAALDAGVSQEYVNALLLELAGCQCGPLLDLLFDAKRSGTFCDHSGNGLVEPESAFDENGPVLKTDYERGHR